MRSAFANPLHATQKSTPRSNISWWTVLRTKHGVLGVLPPMKEEVLAIELRLPARSSSKLYEFIPAFDYTMFLATSDHKFTAIVYERRGTAYIPAICHFGDARCKGLRFFLELATVIPFTKAITTIKPPGRVLLRKSIGISAVTIMVHSFLLNVGILQSRLDHHRSPCMSEL